MQLEDENTEQSDWKIKSKDDFLDEESEED